MSEYNQHPARFNSIGAEKDAHREVLHIDSINYYHDVDSSRGGAVFYDFQNPWETFGIGSIVPRPNREPKKPHDYEYLFDAKTSKSAIAARRGATIALVDPMHFHPVTPSFYQFIEFGDGYTIAETGNSRYIFGDAVEVILATDALTVKNNVIKAALHTDEYSQIPYLQKRRSTRSPAYPVMHNQKSLTIRYLGEVSQGLSSLVAGQKRADLLDAEDIFNFRNKDEHPNMSRAADIYTQTIQNLSLVPGVKAELSRAAEGELTEISLPRVDIDGSSAVCVRFSQTAGNNSQIIADGVTPDGVSRSGSGFHLSRHPSGQVYMVPNDRSKQMQVDVESELYAKQLDAAEKLLQTYFERLNASAKLGITTFNASLPELAAQFRNAGPNEARPKRRLFKRA